MKKVHHAFILGILLFAACAPAASPTENPTSPPQPSTATAPPTETPVPPTATIVPTPLPTLHPNSAMVDIYDIARDPAVDLQLAILIAQQQNKRILLELGGDWCIWCKYLDDFFASHAEILQFRAENFVFVKINVSNENMNEEFLAQYPEPPGYPHIYILESDGTLLHSQNTGELEQGKSYNPDVFLAFLKEWAPKR
jgi:thioredoxin-related protein